MLNRLADLDHNALRLKKKCTKMSFLYSFHLHFHTYLMQKQSSGNDVAVDTPEVSSFGIGTQLLT